MPLVNVIGLGNIFFPDDQSPENIKAVLTDKFKEVGQFVKTAYGNLSPLEQASLLTAPIPVLGDVVGLTSDITTMIQDPESRTILNGLFAAAGALPFVPSGFGAAKRAFSPTDDIIQAVDTTLDTSTAARMARAKEGGHFTSMDLFHGTNADIDAFDLSMGGAVSGSPVGSLGISLALDPDTAGEFARLAGDEGANVVRVFHRADNPASLTLGGTELNTEIAATVQEAWDQGFDSIKINNYTTPAGVTGKSFILVKDPSQIRSVNAAFDPTKRDSANLLASTVLPAAGVGAVVAATQASEDDKGEIL